MPCKFKSRNELFRKSRIAVPVRKPRIVSSSSFVYCFICSKEFAADFRIGKGDHAGCLPAFRFRILHAQDEHFR